MRDDFPSTDDGRDLPEVVSVSFKPESLTAFEEWRMFLVRAAPASKRPALRTSVVVVYLLVACPFLCYLIGMLGRPGLEPEVMAVAGFGVGTLFPIRLWRVKKLLTRLWREQSPFTIELSEESVTLRSRFRCMRIDWPGVVEIRATSREVVLKYRAGDASWLPTRFFADHDHEARFVDFANYGLAQVRQDPTSQAGLV